METKINRSFWDVTALPDFPALARKTKEPPDCSDGSSKFLFRPT
jgi:hypothetical protein